MPRRRQARLADPRRPESDSTVVATLVLALLAGLAAGFFHVLAGPDHLAAVAPMVVDDQRVAWRAGLSWGLGHTAGVLLVGSLLVAFREFLPLDALSAWSERLVGVALVGVGVWGLWRARRPHAHTHVPATPSFAMGTLHGLAGSSHLYGVLPSLMFASRIDSLAYLGGFGAGAIAAMTAFSAALGSAALAAGRSSHAVRQAVLYAASLAAVVVGGVWLFG
ncbi:MAG: hypothetical protein R2708_26905 [Vicinamibacterales bacterium]